VPTRSRRPSPAAHHGARLPTRAELIAETIGDQAAAVNADYRYGDATPVTEPCRGPEDIHHLVANLQVWCADGPDLPGMPAMRWLHGAAWNTPSTPAEIHQPRHRHLTGCSRGVGIRLLRDSPLQAVPADALAATVQEWIEGLKDRGEPLAMLDDRLIQALQRLTGSQPDAGLGTHVGTCAGEPVLGQLGEPLTEAESRQLGELDELHPPDRPGVGALRDRAETAPSPAGLERDVHDVGAAARQMIAHVQQTAHLHLQAGLLTHLPDQRGGQGLALLDLPARQRPRPAGIGVLVEQQNAAVLNDNPSDPNFHPGNLPQGSGQ
jgi:hypothetical protein